MNRRIFLLQRNALPLGYQANVPGGRLELPRVAPLVPKTSAYTNSAIPAMHKLKIYKFLICAPSRDRTYDILLKRELLYQLSYGRKNKIKLNFKELCGPGGNRTHTPLRARNFKSLAATNYATGPYLFLFLPLCVICRL